MTEPHMPNLVETLQNALQRAADNFARCQEENARLAKRVEELERLHSDAAFNSSYWRQRCEGVESGVHAIGQSQSPIRSQLPEPPVKREG